MPDPQLLDYVKKARSIGTPDTTIATDLLAAGWPENDVVLALSVPNTPEKEVQTPVQQPTNIQPQVQNQTPPTQTLPSQVPIQTPNSPAVEPQRQNTNLQKPKTNYLIFIVPIVALFLIAVGIFVFFNSNGNETNNSNQNTNSNENLKEESNLVFNVPKLVGKSSDEIKSILGKPKSETTIEGKVAEMTYEKNDYFLGIAFRPELDNTTDKLVFSFILISHREFVEKSSVLADMGLEENSTDYVLKINSDSDNPDNVLSVVVYEKGSEEAKSVESN